MTLEHRGAASHAIPGAVTSHANDRQHFRDVFSICYLHLLPSAEEGLYIYVWHPSRFTGRISSNKSFVFPKGAKVSQGGQLLNGRAPLATFLALLALFGVLALKPPEPATPK